MAQSNLHSANSDANLSKEGSNEDGWGLGGAIYRILAEAQALYITLAVECCFSYVFKPSGMKNSDAELT
jgi:hypothetical protein